MIKIKSLNKFYNKNKSNEIHVLNDISLELPDCGLVSFLGASGCGKTTLLNVIGGLDRAQGEISYGSFEVNKYEMTKIDKYRNENFGYVFQTYNLLLAETVYDNLKIALELIDIYDQREADSRIEYALKSVGMYKYRKKKAGQLSGGQQQRVAIARALVKHCKIIIADEPTGNLDSANAVEVMNILKSISKKTLVLLVTHNEVLANFYSDHIFKISDGKIVDEYVNVSSSALETANDNVIYLKDMKVTENNFGGVGVKLYSNEEQDIQIEIVERNNTFYIKSNKTVKLLENSNIKLINEHYKPIEKKEDAEYDYDDSFFKNVAQKGNLFKDIISGIKRAFQTFIKPTKKMKVLYSSLALIGVLFAICAISISNAIKVDTGSINADPAYSTLDNSSRYYFAEDADELTRNLQNEAISSIQMVYTKYKDFSYKINYVEEISYSQEYSQIYYNEKVNELVCGVAPKGDEVAISTAVADELLEVYAEVFHTYEDLFKLTVDNNSSKIVGIVDNPYKMIYISKSVYLHNVTSHLYVGDDYTRYYEYEKKYDSYEIIAGRDLTEEDLNTNNVLLSDKFTGYEDLLGYDAPGIGFVVGIFRMKGVENGSQEIIVNANFTQNYAKEYKYSYETENYLLVEGREPEKENECLVSIYSDLEVGDTLTGYKVVGKYNANTQLLRANVLLSISALSIDDYSLKAFITEKEEDVLQSIQGSKFKLKSLYQNEYDGIKQINNEKMAIFGALGGVCLIATAIMVFFLMRSKMVNDIYNIGVYRSLGSSKSKIYLKYFCDTLVMVTFTALITYVLAMFGYLTAIGSINDYFGTELFSKGLGTPLIGIGVLYLVNLGFGLLPIFTLLKKTPAEIIAKYDI